MNRRRYKELERQISARIDGAYDPDDAIAVVHALGALTFAVLAVAEALVTPDALVDADEER